MYQNAIYYIKNAERNIHRDRKKGLQCHMRFSHSSKGAWEQKAFSAAYLVTNKGPLLIMGITQGSRICQYIIYQGLLKIWTEQSKALEQSTQSHFRIFPLRGQKEEPKSHPRGGFFGP